MRPQIQQRPAQLPRSGNAIPTDKPRPPNPSQENQMAIPQVLQNGVVLVTAPQMVPKETMVRTHLLRLRLPPTCRRMSNRQWKRRSRDRQQYQWSRAKFSDCVSLVAYMTARTRGRLNATPNEALRPQAPRLPNPQIIHPPFPARHEQQGPQDQVPQTLSTHSPNILNNFTPLPTVHPHSRPQIRTTNFPRTKPPYKNIKTRRWLPRITRVHSSF